MKHITDEVLDELWQSDDDPRRIVELLELSPHDLETLRRDCGPENAAELGLLLAAAEAWTAQLEGHHVAAATPPPRAPISLGSLLRAPLFSLRPATSSLRVSAEIRPARAKWIIAPRVAACATVAGFVSALAYLVSPHTVPRATPPVSISDTVVECPPATGEAAFLEKALSATEVTRATPASPKDSAPGPSRSNSNTRVEKITSAPRARVNSKTRSFDWIAPFDAHPSPSSSGEAVSVPSSNAESTTQGVPWIVEPVTRDRGH